MRGLKKRTPKKMSPWIALGCSSYFGIKESLAAQKIS